jgi:hypothetical protein
MPFELVWLSWLKLDRHVRLRHRSGMRPLSCTIAALTLPLLAAVAHAESCKLGYVGEVPMQDRPNGFYVTANINGHDVDMRIATSARWPKVTQAVAEQVGLRHEAATGSHLSAEWTNSSATGLRREYQATARHVSFGAAAANGVPILVMGRRSGPPQPEDDNVLGNAMLAAFDVDFDTMGKRLVLFTQSSFCAAPKAYMTGPLYTVPIVTDRADTPGTPEITMKIGDKTFRAMIASDLPTTSITPQAANDVGVNAAMLAADPHGNLHGLGPDVISVPRHVFTGLAIGDITISKLPMLVYDNADQRGIDIALGADFMRKVHVWISNSSHTLIMQVPPAASPPVVQAAKKD